MSCGWILDPATASITGWSIRRLSCYSAARIGTRNLATSDRPSTTGRSFNITIPTKDYKTSLYEELQDPEFAVVYLNVVLVEGSQVRAGKAKGICPRR